MFVITADQVDSRHSADAVGSAIEHLATRLHAEFALPPERTAGDEFQLLLPRAVSALDVVLSLSRTGEWSVGLGVGSVREPLPASIREAAGEAFFGARTAVERAKKKQTRFALEAPEADVTASGLEALVDLLLTTRARRSSEGWQLYDLLATGLTQGAAASRLGISPQAASARASAADLKLEGAVTAALGSLLTTLDAETKGTRK